MFVDSEEGDTNSTRVTAFDYERLIDLEVGARLDGELGNYSILRYKYDNFVVLLHNSYNKPSYSEFTNMREIVDFLNS